MKVLLISNTNNIRNGTGNLTHELCSALKGKVDFKLLLPAKEKRYDYTDYPVEYVLPDYIFDAKTPKILKYLTFNYHTDADIIHSLSEFPYAFLGARIANKSKKPFIFGAIGTYAIRPLFTWPEKYLMRYIYNSASLVTAASGFTRDTINKFVKLNKPIEIIHPGVNFSRFQELVDITDLKTKYAGKKILLTVGGLKARKGQDVIIKALGILKKKRDDFHYICLGGGNLRTYFNDIAIREGVGDDVSFLGEQDEETVVKYFKLCDVYAHTPVMDDWNFEGFGIVYLEAGACRKPVLAADSGGIRDAVLENQTGLIVPENDPVATATAIEKLLDSSELRERLGNNGWQYAKERDWPIIAEKTLDLYKRLSIYKLP